MSFTAYSTAVAGTILTAAFWNQQVRDNGLILKANINDDGTLNPIRRLIAANGTFSGTTITNVSTVVVPVLTALDHLVVRWGCTVGAGLITGGIQVRHVTDGAILFDANNGVNLNTGEHSGGFAFISQDHGGNQKINVFGHFQNDAHVSNATQFRQYASTATWVSAWTLGFALTQSSGSTEWWWSVVLYPGQ